MFIRQKWNCGFRSSRRYTGQSLRQCIERFEPELIQRAELPEPVAVRMEERRNAGQKRKLRRRKILFFCVRGFCIHGRRKPDSLREKSECTKKDAESTERTGAAQPAEHTENSEVMQPTGDQERTGAVQSMESTAQAGNSRIRCRTMPEPKSEAVRDEDYFIRKMRREFCLIITVHLLRVSDKMESSGRMSRWSGSVKECRNRKKSQSRWIYLKKIS